MIPTKIILLTVCQLMCQGRPQLLSLGQIALACRARANRGRR